MAPKMPFLQCGLKRKKMAGYHPDLHAQRAGGCVYNTDDPYLNSSSARQTLPNLIVFEKSSFRSEWGFKPRAPEVLTSNNSSSPGSTATITTIVFRVKR